MHACMPRFNWDVEAGLGRGCAPESATRGGCKCAPRAYTNDQPTHLPQEGELPLVNLAWLQVPYESVHGRERA